MNESDILPMIVLAAIGIGYLLPTIVANLRNHPEATAITALNILAGGTAAGWIAAMVWSLTTIDRD
jgi:Superinfection immunity protein